MTIPKAVSPSTLTPGLYLKVNLLAGSASPGVGELRTLLLAPKSSSGTITVDTEIHTGGGEDTAGTAFGEGTLGHLMAKQFYDAFPTAIVDFGAPTAGTGVATCTFVFSGAPTANAAVGVKVAGREWEVGWLVGESLNDIRDKVVTSINQRTTQLPVVASGSVASTVAVTSKVAGNLGNDIAVRVWLKKVATGTEAVSPSTLSKLTGGATDPDFSDILDVSQGKEYHIILLGISNTDAETTGSSSNVERAIVHVEAFNEGLNAKLQSIVYASTVTQAAAVAAAQARNVGYAQHVFCLNGQMMPGEYAAAEAGDRLQGVALDPACNRIGNRIGTGLVGSEDSIGDNPTTPEKETAIAGGLSILAYDAANNLITVRPVTTYSQNSSGGPDRRLGDVQNVDATYIVARDMRSALPQEFPNAKIVPDQPPGQQELPRGVTEERDIKSFVVSRLRSWVSQGVIIGSRLDEVVENGELVVEVDESDATQVNILIPIRIIPPLAKFGVVVNRNPS